MEANNLNRREFLGGLAALTLMGLPLATGGQATTPAEVDTFLWEQVGRNDSPADRIAYLESNAQFFEQQAAQIRALIAKIEAGLV